MNILFMTLSRIDTIERSSIYCDLLRQFRNQGHNVYVVSPNEKRTGRPTELITVEHVQMLNVAVGNITKNSNLISKGLATVTLEGLFIKAIKKYFADVRFDLVIYSTPPITFSKVISYVKKRDGAKSYLLLKDIFPQNAVDIGMMKKSGPMGLLYQYFRRKEKKLYALSDRIGCMSRANVEYLLKHNPELDSGKVEICPNSIEVTDKSVDAATRQAIREKYEIPLDKTVFVYGGNLGKPQGIPFLIECMKTQKDNDQAYFLIVGAGTEASKLEAYVHEATAGNIRLMERLPKEDYDRMVAGCDVGLIFLDHRFTIPNFPSRLLSYMQAKLPVLACTDPNTDIGQVITEGGFGWWCESNDPNAFVACVNEACNADLGSMGKKGYAYLEEHYSVAKTSETILSKFGAN